MRAAFHTLGCKVNQYETEAIKEAFAERGALIVGENSEADVYVVNTCTVTNIAERKSRQYIRRMKSLNPDALMVVTGCYVQVASEELSEIADIDLLVGNNRKSGICDMVFAELENRYSVPRCDVLEYDQLDSYEDLGIVSSDESSMSRAYIKIQEGCNRFCSYCRIPYARGRVRSREPEDVIKEAELLIEKGYKEIVLTGINTALYGTEEAFLNKRESDEERLSGLEILIKRLDSIDADFRIRLSSLEPNVVDKSDVEKLLGYEKLCRHLHLSIQSGSDNVLKNMGRRYTVDEYLEIVEALRAFDPLYGITTDIIAGFPGEGDDDHRKTLETIERAGFGRVHVFRYSPRTGTKAAKMPDKVDGKTKSVRAAELTEAAALSAEKFIRKNEGATERILVEEHSGDYAAGYTGSYIRAYAHDPDRHLKEGSFCSVRVSEPFRDGALVEPL